ncbi:MAG: WcaF family extracellular polysaccharide biosynthesis acetyltransferase [Sphingobacteriaceae bacterium]
MSQTDLTRFNNNPYQTGASKFKRLLWLYVNAIFMKTSIIPVSAFKVFLLRAFGAKVGASVNIKPGVNIKYPWLLTIGDHSWVGENVWIDNLVMVSIGSHACISQGAMLLTGNHDYKKISFDLMTGTIVLDNGVWIGAKAIVCQGVRAGSHAVLAVGSVANKDLEAYGIYQGNPAVKIRERNITDVVPSK